jgi:glycerol-3-phosphate dehydrogenase (NAD(P)+)
MQQLARARVTLELTPDAVGAQVGGALKNMIAIACGMATAQGMGENARAGIITRGLDDMRRLTLAMGGRVETLLGSSGVGDLFLTAASEQSRNTRLGMRLGRPGAEAGSEAGELAEGAVSAMSVQVLERKYGLRLNVAAACATCCSSACRPNRPCTACCTKARRPCSRRLRGRRGPPPSGPESVATARCDRVRSPGA